MAVGLLCGSAQMLSLFLRRMTEVIRPTIGQYLYCLQDQRSPNVSSTTSCMSGFKSRVKLCDSLSGFLNGHSCSTALIKTTENWRPSLDQKQCVAAIIIDLSRAFDSMCHRLLTAELRAYSLGYNSVKLMNSYLHCRLQRVKLNGNFSNQRTVKSGVLQGSLLGPLFFNIFINDMNSVFL